MPHHYSKAATAAALILVASVIGCNLYKVIDTPDHEGDDTQVVLQSDDAAATDVSVSVPDANQCVVDVNDTKASTPEAVADSNAVETKAIIPAEDDASRYLNAVIAWADLVLEHGRDKYGPKHTPLFVDGLNIHTLEPVKWISPKGDWRTATETEEWILCNFANQQILMRTLDGLSTLTGDPKYREAAMRTIEYALKHLRAPNGLIYWGEVSAYDASADQVRGKDIHSFKMDYPYYELMWKVDSRETKRFIEAYWSAHVNDWSNLDFNRLASLQSALEEPWNHEYKGGPTFFKSKFGSRGFYNTAASMVQAGTTLYRLSHQEQPLVWSKRLTNRFIDTRHPKTGMSLPYYNNIISPLGDDLKEHFQNPRIGYFPSQLFEERRHISIRPANSPVLIWLSLILVGDTLGEQGKEFKQRALEELTAWGKVSYRKGGNSFVPILTDGTNIEGYVSKWYASHAPKGGDIATSLFADLGFFWGYTVAYRATGDEFMWEMVRDIALGNNFGDIGRTPTHKPELQTNTTSSDVYGLLGFLELYAKTNKSEFLKMAQHIGDNIVDNQFHKGFFVSSKRHIYTRFDCFEPLALLHLQAAITSKKGFVPQVWPCYPVFATPYRYKVKDVDRRVIYSLTESPEPPMSLQEAAAVGDIELVCSLLDKGVGVNRWENVMADTALHRAAISGHKDIVKLLLEKGALVDSLDSWPGATPLHYAVEEGHKEIAELLIAHGADANAKRTGYPNGDTPLHSAARASHEDIVGLLIDSGADVNVKNGQGQTPIDLAINQGQKEIAKLLIVKSGDVSMHMAAYIGDLQRVEKFIDDGADVDTEDQDGQTALHHAAKGGEMGMVEFLIAKGAGVNAKDNRSFTPLHEAVRGKHKDVVALLIDNGANVNAGARGGYTPMYYAAWSGITEVVELLVEKGADINVKDEWGWTPLHYMAQDNLRDRAEFLIVKGADVNAKDNNGKTALSVAKEKGHTEIVELLRKYGAKE